MPEGVGAVAEHAGDVFPHNDGGMLVLLLSFKIDMVGKLNIRERQLAAWVVKPLTQPGNTERLAGRTANENVRDWQRATADFTGELSHIAGIRDVRPVVCQDGTGKRVDFTEPERMKGQVTPGDADGLNTTTDGTVSQNVGCHDFPGERCSMAFGMSALRLEMKGGHRNG